MATQKLNIDIVARDRSNQALGKLQGSLGKVKNAVFSLQSAFISLGAGLAIRSLVNTGKQIEGLQVRLKFLFGSAKEGGKAFDPLDKFALQKKADSNIIASIANKILVDTSIEESVKK